MCVGLCCLMSVLLTLALTFLWFFWFLCSPLFYYSFLLLQPSVPLIPVMSNEDERDKPTTTDTDLFQQAPHIFMRLPRPTEFPLQSFQGRTALPRPHNWVNQFAGMAPPYNRPPSSVSVGDNPSRQGDRAAFDWFTFVVTLICVVAVAQFFIGAATLRRSREEPAAVVGQQQPPPQTQGTPPSTSSNNSILKHSGTNSAESSRSSVTDAVTCSISESGNDGKGLLYSLAISLTCRVPYCLVLHSAVLDFTTLGIMAHDIACNDIVFLPRTSLPFLPHKIIQA